MALPEQIRKQTEAVQELYKQLETSDSTGAPANDADGTATSTEQQDTNQQADESHVEGTAAQSTEVEQKLVDTGAEEDLPKDDFVQKYKTLQGMYNAEVPRLHSQNRDLQSRVQQMEQLLATLSAQTNSAPPATTEVVCYRIRCRRLWRFDRGNATCVPRRNVVGYAEDESD